MLPVTCMVPYTNVVCVLVDRSKRPRRCQLYCKLPLVLYSVCSYAIHCTLVPITQPQERDNSAYKHLMCSLRWPSFIKHNEDPTIHVMSSRYFDLHMTSIRPQNKCDEMVSRAQEANRAMCRSIHTTVS